MIDELLMERYQLAKARIIEMCDDTQDYVRSIANILKLCTYAYENQSDRKLIEELYDGISKLNYSHSYANPTYAKEKLGADYSYYSYLAAYVYDGISYAVQKNIFQLVIRMELFLEFYTINSEQPEHVAAELKQAIYYHMYDYSTLFAEEKVKKMVDPSYDFAYHLITTSDLSTLDYLYQYGFPIGDNERGIASFLSKLDDAVIQKMAFIYVDGFRRGFVAANIDLVKKKTVNIRYMIGFERLVKEAIAQFQQLGLSPVIYEMNIWDRAGYMSSAMNKQFVYDHRYDDALYRNHAYDMKVLAELRAQYEQSKILARGFAGPAVIEIFGEDLFVPEVKKENMKYSPLQEKEAISFQTKSRLLVNEYIPQEEYSFTIIAFPIPEIGPSFEQIFEETLKVNSLDVSLYESIQTTIIQALDEGEQVRIVGKGNNQTNLIVGLQAIKDKQTQTGFENCLADVNIPLGEVFTSPELKTTCGKLHVSKVYLNELLYKDFTLYIEQGVIVDYSCSNYEKIEDNKAYIKENVLYQYETMPMGEFAIGTNTVAYAMGKTFDISHKLPILIAEKTGPHFAFGDTCYSMSEQVKVTNPDGKEMIAKENDFSRLRDTDREKAYFHHHTDVTIPYDELGEITVLCKSGKEIPIICNGQFVLAGTEELNKPLNN